MREGTINNPISVTKLARRGSMDGVPVTLIGNVRRITAKAVHFACHDLPTKHGMDTPFWFPLSALMPGEKVDEGSTQITVQGWFMRRHER